MECAWWYLLVFSLTVEQQNNWYFSLTPCVCNELSEAFSADKFAVARIQRCQGSATMTCMHIQEDRFCLCMWAHASFIYKAFFCSRAWIKTFPIFFGAWRQSPKAATQPRFLGCLLLHYALAMRQHSLVMNDLSSTLCVRVSVQWCPVFRPFSHVFSDLPWAYEVFACFNYFTGEQSRDYMYNVCEVDRVVSVLGSQWRQMF